MFLLVGGGLLVLCGNSLSFTESSTGKERDSETFSSRIIDIERFSQDRLLVCLSDGSIYQVFEKNGSPDVIFLLQKASGSYSAACKKPWRISA